MLSLLAFSPTAPTPRCRLSASQVRPLSVPSLHPSLVSTLYRKCAEAAWMSTIPCSNVIHRNRDVGHQCGAFSRHRASSLSVGRSPLHDMHIFDVNKCTYVYRQLPSSPLWHPHKNVFNVAKCGAVRHLASAVIRTSSFIVDRSSFQMWGLPTPRSCQSVFTGLSRPSISAKACSPGSAPARTKSW
jgi:hypothetical protein